MLVDIANYETGGKPGPTSRHGSYFFPEVNLLHSFRAGILSLTVLRHTIRNQHPNPPPPPPKASFEVRSPKAKVTQHDRPHKKDPKPMPNLGETPLRLGIYRLKVQTPGVEEATSCETSESACKAYTVRVLYLQRVYRVL